MLYRKIVYSRNSFFLFRILFLNIASEAVKLIFLIFNFNLTISFKIMYHTNSPTPPNNGPKKIRSVLNLRLDRVRSSNIPIRKQKGNKKILKIIIKNILNLLKNCQIVSKNRVSEQHLTEIMKLF